MYEFYQIVRSNFTLTFLIEITNFAFKILDYQILIRLGLHMPVVNPTVTEINTLKGYTEVSPCFRTTKGVVL